jgi:mRNA-degrading endonuclease RelE of RelBE toxin-antitoxin system
MSSEFKIVTTESFNKSVYKLSKKYPSLASDLVELRSMLNDNPRAGVPLGKDCYKIRIKISSKNAGKSGGARVITYVKIQAKRITLLDIYDKSEKETITDKELADLLKKAEE